MDEIARKHGHTVHRLPAYHCHLNPIELIWGQVKMEVRRANSNDCQTMQKVEEIARAAIENVTREKWQNCIRHVRKLEEDYMSKDIAVYHLLEKFVIDLADTSSDEEEV